jgi:competence protein ComEC
VRRKNARTKYLLFLWLFPLVAFFYEDEQEGWQVDVLDVGQGLSVLVSHDGSHILYDTGPSFPSGFNTADAAIIPLLKSRGIETIDLLIISHNDNDHAGGQSILLSAMNVKEVISSEDSCFNGWNRQFGELRFEALWPEAPMSADENESSCVVKVSDSHHSLLLTGDIDKRVERKLIKLRGDKLRSELIVVPHHGSNSSSSVAFIRQVSPRYAVFSQGFLNRWRFPRPEVVDRYANERVSMFSTSDAGQISFSFKSTQTNISLFREDKYPYWYANRVHADTTNGY